MGVRPVDGDMSSVPEQFYELLTERPTYAVLTTMLPDGLPHMSVVWVDYDPESDRILVNTERDRRKERNVRGDPRAGLLAVDPDNWFRWVAVSGEVDAVTTEGAREHIDLLAKRYMGEESYPNPIETERVILELRPDHVTGFEGG